MLLKRRLPSSRGEVRVKPWLAYIYLVVQSRVLTGRDVRGLGVDSDGGVICLLIAQLGVIETCRGSIEDEEFSYTVYIKDIPKKRLVDVLVFRRTNT